MEEKRIIFGGGRRQGKSYLKEAWENANQEREAMLKTGNRAKRRAAVARAKKGE